MKLAKIFLLIAVIIGIFIRLFRLDFQSIWFDELFTVLLAKLNLSDIISYSQNKPVAAYMELYANPHPPLHSFFMHYWMQFFGESTFMVRLSSALTGIFAIFITYLMSKKRFNEQTAICLTIITALSTTLLFYSQEARSYIFLYTFSLVLTFWWLDILKELKNSGPTTLLLVKYTVVSIISCFTHYFAAVLAFFQISYLLYQRKYIEQFLVMGASILSPFLIWLIFDSNSTGYGASNGIWMKKANLYYLEMFVDFIFNRYLIVFLLVPFFLSLKNNFDDRAKALLYLFITPVVSIFLISFFYPVFYPRYLIIILPAFYILISLGISSCKYLSGNKSVIYIFFVSLISLFIFLFIRADNIQDCNYYKSVCNNAFYKPHKQDWRGIVNYIAKNYNNDSMIFVLREYDMFAYLLSKTRVNKVFKLGYLRLDNNLFKIPEYSKEIKTLYITGGIGKLTPNELSYISSYYDCIYKDFTGLPLYECTSKYKEE